MANKIKKECERLAAKEEFMEAYKKATGTDLVKEVNVTEFTKILNDNLELRRLFRVAVTPTEEDAVKAGLSNLFPS